MVETSTSVD